MSLVGAQEAAKIVADGGIIGYRTETFYGLAVDPRNPGALSRLAQLKGRSELAPFALIVATMDDAMLWMRHGDNEPPKQALQWCAEHWPGPLTLVVPAPPNTHHTLLGPGDGIGLRISSNAGARELAGLCGGAITATSANPSGQAPASSAEQVLAYFGPEFPVVDGGVSTAAAPSTVVSLLGDAPKVLRAGAISEETLGIATR